MIIELLLVALIAVPAYAGLRAIPYDVRPVNRDELFASAMEEVSIQAAVSAAGLRRCGEAIRQAGLSFAEMAERIERNRHVFTGETKVSYDGIDLSALTVKIDLADLESP